MYSHCCEKKIKKICLFIHSKIVWIFKMTTLKEKMFITSIHMSCSILDYYYCSQVIGLHLSGSWFFIDFACISVYSRGQFESMFLLFHHIHRRNYLTINLKILEIEANIIILQLLLVFETSLTINYLPWYKITFSNVLLWSLPDSSPRKFHPIKPCKFS